MRYQASVRVLSERLPRDPRGGGLKKFYFFGVRRNPPQPYFTPLGRERDVCTTSMNYNKKQSERAKPPIKYLVNI